MKPTYSLPEFIDLAVSKRKTSVRQMSFAAQKNGHRVTATTLNQIRNGSYKSKPSRETLSAIAWLAEMDETLVFAAAGQSVPGPPLADELPPGSDSLSPKSRKAVVEMVRVLVDLEKMNNDSTTILHGIREQGLAKAGDWHKAVRPVAPTSDTSQGQKTEPDNPEDALDLHGVTQLSGNDAEKIPKPPLHQMAAHPNHKTDSQKWETTHGERGEENQDSEEDGR